MRANKNNRENIHKLIFCRVQNLKKNLVDIDYYESLFFFLSEHRTLLSLETIDTVSMSLSCFKSIH